MLSKTPRFYEAPAVMSKRKREFDFTGREVMNILLDFCRAKGHEISPKSEIWINGLASDAGDVRITVLGD